jgi:hypothetical protein
MGKQIQKVFDSGPGPIRATIELSGAALSLFTIKDKKEIFMSVMQAVGDDWIAKALPKRFTNYARTLGYRVSKRWMDKKRKYGEPLPFVWEGDMRESVLTKSKAQPGGTSKNPYVTIRMPYTHGIKKMYVPVMRSLPAHEMKTLAKVAAVALQAAMQDKMQQNYEARASAPPKQKRARATAPKKRK